MITYVMLALYLSSIDLIFFATTSGRLSNDDGNGNDNAAKQ